MGLNDQTTTQENTNRNFATNKLSTRDLVRTALFTAVICVMSQLSIPTQPIPFSLALLAIFLTGALLTPKYSFLAILVYLLLGAFGLPVYAGFKGGIQVLTGMTGGYLMAYPIMALITSLFCTYVKLPKVLSLVSGMLIALIACYLIGTLWFTYAAGVDFPSALALCVVPFVLFDLLKIALATSMSLVIRKLLYRYYL